MASSTIQQVNSCPDYINQFIQTNMEQLLNIYGAGYEANDKEGCLGFMCNQETNKMDVMFLNRDNITTMLTAMLGKFKIKYTRRKKSFSQR